MKFSASNLAWPTENDHSAHDLMQKIGINAVEIAPTKLWGDWGNISLADVALYKNYLSTRGMNVSALQSVHYGADDLSIFMFQDGASKMISHMTKVFEIAATLSSPVVVFGSPSLRKIPNNMSYENCIDEARSMLYLLAQIASDIGEINLAIEPCPEQYGSEIMRDTREVRSLIGDADTKRPENLRLHLDAGAIALNQEGQLILDGSEPHFHASQPFLKSWEAPSHVHQFCAHELHSRGYDGFISLEMIEASPDPLLSLELALKNMIELYS